MDIRIENLLFGRNGRCLLDIAALEFRNGRTIALFGPNGAGKSTLLRLIAALDRPTSGKIFLGRQLVRPTIATRRHLAYAFQEPTFLNCSMRENLDLGLRLRGIAAVERPARIAEVARECGVMQLLERRPRALSGGEAQRFNLARALSLRAAVTLLDEPLSGIDGPAREHLLGDLPQLLARFATTTILVTHDRYEAFRLADDLIVMLDGRVRAAGEKVKIFRNPPDRETALLLGYTLVPQDAKVLAIPPRGLKLGAGQAHFDLVVEQVVDMGLQHEIWGYIGATRVSIPLSDNSVPLPTPGDNVLVSADEIIGFPA
ncbi:MAG: ABC transporter ATP-binding protein [Cyanobacteria bacterium NC_groundwater_1444_Ag_S-0.65um_54_12]|nr:ABC transporter ATP-binding protein [Cyanobacteria bacterium NC_groundwater_1444_Ag_S-0.65um_54_12]